MKKIYLLTLAGLTAVSFTTLAQSSPRDARNGAAPAGRQLLASAAPRPVTKARPLAADVTVSGKVVDEKGVELPGVTVTVKGGTQGTTTDGTGSFRLTVPESSTVLVFSYVGFIKQEITVGNQSSITVTLLPDTQILNEVVVVGYGSQRRQDITSAVSVIDMSTLGEQPANNPNQILQGRAPGVTVKQTSGAPGGEFQVRVRGIGSLGAGSDPLYVVDGFVVGTSVGQNLNSNDIESVTVLKDAASTAIYGARGSNGVVLITTKQAKNMFWIV